MNLKERFRVALYRRPAPLIASLLLLVLLLTLGLWWGISAALDPYDCRMAPEVTIGGLDVAGMTKSEARKALTTALKESLYAHALTVQLPEAELTLTSEQLSASVKVGQAVRRAYALGREDGPFDPELSLLPWLKVDEEQIRGVLDAYAAQYNTQLRQPEWKLSGQAPDLSTEAFDPELPEQQLVLTKGLPTMQLDVNEVYGNILLTCSKAITLCREGNFSVRPEVTPEALPEELDLEAIYQEISRQPVDDSLDMENYGFVPGAYGYGFDRDAAAAALAEAPWGETVTVPMVITEPQILGDAVYFRDVLGSCETKHTDDENRNTNLRLLCAALDGVVLHPGEEFSYNGTVGERTEAKGYKPANAYSGTRLVKDIGGGVCQGSTTLYNCALLADVEILERVCHGAKVGYVPLGLDAAVNWNTKTDLRFKNTFHFPMMIKAEVSDGYVKMQLLGTDEKDYYVEMRCGVGDENGITYAVSYKCKYDKETGEQLSKELEARSTYYNLDN